MDIGGMRRAAIAWTTSSSAVATIEMVRDGKLPQRGVLKQEMIPMDLFLSTRTGNNFAIDQKSRL
jgi:saccharopine dehydrogenase-like NADP-dependent oxidoreductase